MEKSKDEMRGKEERACGEIYFNSELGKWNEGYFQ